MRTSRCVGFCVATCERLTFYPQKKRLLSILLGELRHLGNEWQSEAGGGKTFCLSAFLEVVGLGGFSICHALPPPASIRHATFYATFYATVQKRTLTAATGEKDSNLYE